MPKATFAALRADLDRELHNLERLISEMSQLLHVLPPTPTFVEIRTAGSILHDYYTGVERMRQRVALEVDGSLPQGSDWHVQLLKRMAAPLPGFRPQVFDESLAAQLEEYLRFRHVFRNIYGFELRWELCQPLVAYLSALHTSVGTAVREFQGFLSTIESESS